MRRWPIPSLPILGLCVLAVIAIHSPELEHERDPAAVATRIGELHTGERSADDFERVIATLTRNH